MDASPNHTPTKRMEYVLLHRRTPSAILSKPSGELVSSPQESLSEQSSTNPSPLGRGHRVKKPNIRLSSALSELGMSENEHKHPRRPLKRPRRVPPPETVEGPRIWCHQCHQDRSNEPTIACTPCGKSYCYTCMTRRYGEKVTPDQHNDWTCPRCQNYCDCIKCIRIRKVCGTSCPDAQTLSTARSVMGESRLTRARAKKRSAESTTFLETHCPVPDFGAVIRVDRVGQPLDDAMYDFKALSETTEMKAEGWTLAELHDRDNESYETLAIQADLRLTSDSTLLSTPTSSSALPGTPHTSLHAFTSDDTPFDPLRALKSFPSPDDAPPHSISPLELTSDFSTMLTYTYSPTIPQTVVDEYGITGVVPINPSGHESPPKMDMRHGALMLFDAGSPETPEQDTPVDKDRLERTSGPSSGLNHLTGSPLADADIATMSRFLNDEMFS